MSSSPHDISDEHITEDTSSLTAQVEASDVIRLIIHHLTECGLHSSARVIREESGIGAAATHSNLRLLCETGQWGEVRWLDALEYPLSLAREHEVLEIRSGAMPDLVACQTFSVTG